MSRLYFSERELGPKPRIETEIEASVWGGLVLFINGLAEQGYFGKHFPLMCPDNDGVVGTDEADMSLAILAEFPDIRFPFSPSEMPPAFTVLDLLEFCHEHIAKPVRGYHHSYWGVYHLDFDVEQGQMFLIN